MKWYTEFPMTMFRLNAGNTIKLRAYSAAKPNKSYDVVTYDGDFVRPTDDFTQYHHPNGASMRPEGKVLTGLVDNFKGNNVMVYKVPKGTSVPEDLLLVHEHTDHYSLQPRVQMSVEDLNAKLDSFYSTFATAFKREKWLEKYNASKASKGKPSKDSKPGKSSTTQASSSSTIGQASNKNAEGWQWSDQYQRYYIIGSDGKTHWAAENSTSIRPSSSHSTTSQQGKKGSG
ncbi:hypothetical protein C8A00DRAFT_17241 [Chaetomidium leptoderma]|uniref:Tse2 ADP-ribosyltransferase toxin domain-containing protein n=1 Tax=Chaetomidium leptoderma TaxID=669021 RepID=A0AAN6ZUF8_9PEZI|nr:hypothetical protein C8A00DRAFT_17241 [Chaetomidium leptoderma]